MLKSEKGQSMVEFAIAFLFLLFFLMGIFEFGWLMGNKLLATNASREGARYAAIHHDEGTCEADTVSVVQNAMAINVLTSSNIDVDLDDSESVVVNISYSVDHLTGFIPSSVVNNPFPITTSTTMKKE